MSLEVGIKRVATVGLAAVLLASGCGAAAEGGGEEYVSPSPSPTVECVSFPTDRIQDGDWFDFPVTVEKASAVRSEDFAAVWYVAATAHDRKGQEITGAWAVLGEDMDGLAMAVGTGEIFSSLGKAISPDAPIGGPKKVEKILGLPLYPHGYMEAKGCVR